LLLNTPVFADSTGSSWIPTAAGISLTGLTGSLTTGYADALIPAFGQATSFLYFDPQFLFHNDNNYASSLGLGGRKLTDSAGIFGAYVFADYNHAQSGHGFWFVSPGVERLGNNIDFSANLYVPIGSQQVNTGEIFASELGNYNYVNFSGHDEYDQLMNTSESVGIGGDAEIGLRLPVGNNTKVYVGGYYFNPKKTTTSNNITGSSVRLEIPLTDHVNLLASDAYDNLNHNTVKIGLSLALDGRHTALHTHDDLTNRMVDPIQRNLIAVAGGSGTSQPVVASSTPTGQQALAMNNISFFDPNGSGNGDGSYENPFDNFTQENVDNANRLGNTNLFINSGTYTISGSGIMLTNDNVFGRQSYHGNLFAQDAMDDNRPLFNMTGDTGFTLSGNNVISGIRINGSNCPTDSEGISIINDTTASVHDVVNNVDISNVNIGLYALNSSSGQLNLEVNKSNFINNISNGVYLYNSGTEGTFNFLETGGNINGTTGNYLSAGLYAKNEGTAMNIVLKGIHFDANYNAVEVGNSFAGTLNFKANTLSVNGLSSMGPGYGLSFTNYNNGSIIASITNSVVAYNGEGVFFENMGSGIQQLDITDTVLAKNYYGLEVLNIGSSEVLTNINNSTMSNNVNGILLMNQSGGIINLNVIDSGFIDNTVGIYGYNSGAKYSGGQVFVNVTDSTFLGNGSDTNNAPDVNWNINL